jgi:hypothetical protein
MWQAMHYIRNLKIIVKVCSAVKGSSYLSALIGRVECMHNDSKQQLW